MKKKQPKTLSEEFGLPKGSFVKHVRATQRKDKADEKAHAKRLTKAMNKKLSQKRIDQLSNDVSEDIASGTKDELRQVIRYWMERAEDARQKSQSHNEDAMRGIIETSRKERESYQRAFDEMRRSTPQPPPMTFPSPPIYVWPYMPYHTPSPYEVTCNAAPQPYSHTP